MTLFLAGVFLSLVTIAVVVLLNRGKSPLESMPMQIESCVPFLVVAFAALPRAFPSFFQRLLGHSIDASYTIVRASDGMKITDTWFLGRWLGPLHSLATVVIAVGILWAGWNLVKRSSVISNVLALTLGTAWITAELMMGHLLLAPFD
jgi:hypothetical protein